MKTTTALFFVLMLGASLMLELFSQTLQVPAATNASVTNQNTTKPAPSFLKTCMGRSASYFRTFMPFDEDPCNHLPTSKTVC